MRSIFSAAAMLAALSPAAAPAHPTGSPVYRPAGPSRSSDAGAHESHGSQGDFKVPFDVPVAPKPLPGSLRASSAFQQASPQTTFNPLRWRGLVTNPAGLWYQPGWYAPACAANTLWNPFGTPPANASALQNGDNEFGTKIASLVDGKGLLPTYGSEGEKNAAGLAAGAANAPSVGAVTLQIGTPATECGIPNFTSFPI